MNRRGFLAAAGVRAVSAAAAAAVASGLGGYLTGRLEPRENMTTMQRTLVETVTERGTVTLTALSTKTVTSVSPQTHTSTVTQRLTVVSEAWSTGLNHRLVPGRLLDVVVDAGRVLREVNRRVLGVSFFHVGDGDAGWRTEGRCRAGLPVDRHGSYRLDNHPCGDFEPAVRGLGLRMTRVHELAMYDRWKHAGKAAENWYVQFDAKQALDIWSSMADRLNIPQESIVLGIQLYTTQQDKDTIYPRPEFWAELVRYSMDRGYRFRMWEVGNEVYIPIVEKETGFVLNGFADSRDSLDTRVERFSRYLRDVSTAIKSVQPEAQIGLSINGVEDLTRREAWTQMVLEKTAGFYDFLIGHYYNWSDGIVADDMLEYFTLAYNYAVMKVQAMQLEMAGQFPQNQGKHIYHYDTEWGAAGTRKAGDWNVYSEPRNGNTYGMLQRAVRLVYYLREGLVEGASTWTMFTRNPSSEPAFGLLTHEDPNLRSMVYWLYYYFQRFLGDFVLDARGTAPYSYWVFSHSLWQGLALPASGPSTPLIATKSSDGKQVSIIIVNASENNTPELHLLLGNFESKTMVSYVLRDNRQNWRDSSPFSTREEDFVQAYEGITLATNGRTITGRIPSRSVLFIKLSS
ncbi:MAG: glycosyl hydrolase 53 family protein [Nitrososphaerota archaeon]